MGDEEKQATNIEKTNNKNAYIEKEIKKVDVWRYKPYLCVVKHIDIKTGKRVILLNEREAMGHDIYSGYRTELKFKDKKVVAIVDTTSELVKEGEIGIFSDILKEMNLKEGDTVEILHLDRPASIEYIKKKLDGKALTKQEISVIVNDIMDGKLSEIEASAWVSAVYINGFSDEEIIALTNATVESGDQLDLFASPILDKHCSGGVAGNRTTMIVVPIIAALKLYIPKTSSRAITSAAGTADVVEVLANVEFSIDEMREIVKKTYGAMVWGGGMRLAPVDDKLIRIRNPLSLDPEGMLLASILAKKKAVGAEYLVVDIPVGRGAKIADMARGQELANHFIRIGKRLGISTDVLITDGAEPVGFGVGPALECRDVLEVLEGRGPEDLKHKSCILAGKLLELCGKAEPGGGYAMALKTIETGKALQKFREIIEAQGGDPNVRSQDINVGEYSYDVFAERSGRIYHIDNKVISKIARIAGAPLDKGAGIYLYRFRGDRIEKGDKLFTIYAESEAKLEFAIKALHDLEPIEMRKMLLGEVRGDVSSDNSTNA
jgi:AMP phosphorylase